MRKEICVPFAECPSRYLMLQIKPSVRPNSEQGYANGGARSKCEEKGKEASPREVAKGCCGGRDHSHARSCSTSQPLGLWISLTSINEFVWLENGPLKRARSWISLP